MNKLKTIQLAAEDFTSNFGLYLIDNITEEYIEYKYEEIPLSEELKLKIKDWYNTYYKFTGMNIKELGDHTEEITDLDNTGIEIVKSISKELKGKLDCKVTYYSRGKDEFLFETTTD
jgi:hypothetical protein